MNSCNNQQEISKSNSSISDEEEVVDTVNKYRQDLLNEVIPNIPTKKLADHATPEKVVEQKNNSEVIDSQKRLRNALIRKKRQ
ncbi:hypothetical protein RhiirA4_489798 [Rhizophagus irregularis]|uniref:Uncharacterized protein n=1 Tax=Rhizophagus irregularis TaxID=588596 RepID=A0A2I1HV48_9GLOM|nr:hypothetical protein RhiirA4_489798 [Rhizophagus irregularis]